MKMKLWLVPFLAVLLSGCLSAVNTNPPSSYIVSMVPNVSKHNSSGNTIMVVAPETRPAYNSTQMAYTIQPFQISYFGKNQWAETPSQMLQPLMVQTLQKTKFYRAVVTPPFLGRYNYVLSTQITKFQQNFVRHPNAVEISMNAQLTRTLTNQTVAARQFTIVVPIGEKTPFGGVLATNYATSQLMKQLADFCIRNTGRN